MNGEALSIGGSINQSLWLFGHYFLTFNVLAFLLHIPFAFLIFWIPELGILADGELGTWIASGLTFVIIFIEGYLLQAIVTVCVVRHLQEAPVTIGDAISVSFAMLGRVILVGMLAFVLMTLGFLLIIPGIIVAVALSVAIPVTIVEGLPATGSLHRSWALTDGNRWRIFGLFLIVFIAIVIYGGILGGVLGVAGLLETSTEDVLLDFLLLPASVLLSVVIAVIYHELRRAKDGVDIKTLAAVFD